jgi:hypothetical protein
MCKWMSMHSQLFDEEISVRALASSGLLTFNVVVVYMLDSLNLRQRDVWCNFVKSLFQSLLLQVSLLRIVHWANSEAIWHCMLYFNTCACLIYAPAPKFACKPAMKSSTEGNNGKLIKQCWTTGDTEHESIKMLHQWKRVKSRHGHMRICYEIKSIDRFYFLLK